MKHEGISRAFRILPTILVYGLFMLMILVWAFPVIWVILTSMKHRTEIFTIPPTIFFTPTLTHYVDALTGNDILPGIVNSFLVATGATIVTLLIAVPAGYAFSRIRFPFRDKLSFFTLIAQMAPPIGLIIPCFLLLNRMRMLDTYTGLIAVHMTLTVPFSIWLMVTYFQDLPSSLEEAAMLDGVSPFNTFLKVVLPNAWGGIGVTAIFAFIESWNEFLYAVVLTGSNTKTAPVAIFGFLAAEESRWGPFTATGVMIMAPVIVVALIAQRHIVKGMTMGATKG
ncbi:MAG: ABC transporter permease [Deltaproteobacteria bacterium HGW-Deltaproteobacteria-21]|nr:MAG: ABC transporter permease [Deltaproteobacteria bacterium HGW-Deltaproteobacteria-21]